VKDTKQRHEVLIVIDEEGSLFSQNNKKNDVNEWKKKKKKRAFTFTHFIGVLFIMEDKREGVNNRKYTGIIPPYPRMTIRIILSP